MYEGIKIRDAATASKNEQKNKLDLRHQITSLKPNRYPILDLAFSTKHLRDLCEIEESARNSFGERVSSMLKERLADLIAARSPCELPVGSPEPEGEDNMTLQLCDGYQIRFRANHLSNPVDHSGGVIWSEVTRILVLSISCGDGE